MGSLASCTSFNLLGCLLLASAGVMVIASVTAPNDMAQPLVALGLVSAGASSVLLMLERRGLILASLTALLASLAVLKISHEYWPLATLLSVLAALLAGVERWQASLPLIAPPTALAAALSPGEYRWLVLAAYIVALGLATAAHFRRIHPIAMSLGAVVPLAMPGLPALIAALAVTLVYLAVIRAVEASRCPFRTDSRTLMAGSILTLAGFMAWSLTKTPLEPLQPLAETIGYPLALSGTLILVASNLTPYTQAPQEPG